MAACIQCRLPARPTDVQGLRAAACLSPRQAAKRCCCTPWQCIVSRLWQRLCVRQDELSPGFPRMASVLCG